MKKADPLAHLRARNDTMRETIDSTIENVRKQTAQLIDAERSAAKLTAEASSSDGLVRVVVNAAGVPIDITLASTTWKRTTPRKLQLSILHTLQTAAQQVAQERADILPPMTVDLAGVAGLPELASTQQLFSPLLPSAGTTDAQNSGSMDSEFSDRDFTADVTTDRSSW